MREAHPDERLVGIDYYASDADGVGGVLRADPGDFRVREVELAGLDPAPPDADQGDYAHLLLRVTLRGWDTNDFASRLSDALGISRERVSWAGTKDKRAVTTQLFSVRGADAADVPEIRDAEIEVVGRLGRNLTFGDLAGNAFEIGVTDPESPENVATITAELAAFAGERDGGAGDRGEGGGNDGDGRSGNDGGVGTATDSPSGGAIAVPNYFGHQRFGSRRPITHVVGLHVLRGEWREAVLSYAGNPSDGEPDETRAARAFVDEQAASDDPDWAAAAERTPHYLGYERAMLHRLAEADAAEADADFRRALEAVPSNLQRLFVNAAQSYAFNRILSERFARGLPFDRPVVGDVVCFVDREAPEELSVPDVDRSQRVTDRRVDVVTRHCERGRAFVTAPLVGTDTEFAEGEPGEIERGALADLDLRRSDFDLPGEFRSTGTRRAITVRTALDVGADPLTFRFGLPHGSYATAVMREYLKTGPLDL
ncbi:MAG: tRNA pseudouridine(13) synthase TruD [Salinigranum sp.]